MYATELDEKVSSPDLFTSFNGKIAEVISNSVRPVLDARKRFANHAWLNLVSQCKIKEALKWHFL